MQINPRARRALILGIPLAILLYLIPEVILPYIDSFSQLRTDVDQKSELLK